MIQPSHSAHLAASFPDQWDDQARCRSCGASGMHVFYAVEDVPVHSSILMPTRDAALAYPRHELRLGFCPACGLIANTVFDASHDQHPSAYEETQGFSATFNRFARQLARRLIDRHGLPRKTVLEIGCGKGEFLALLCDLAPCRGIGIDPAFRPDRFSGRGDSQIEFIQEPYDDRFANLAADFVVCRHTLEHIGPTFEFLGGLRRNLGTRQAEVFFEVPDVTRALREGAFWDLYYEHCSYFSAGSLARLFRLARFEVVDLETAYEGQYVLITARPAPDVTDPRLAPERDLDRLGGFVRAFPQVCSATLEKWNEYVTGRAAARGRVIVWGSGSKGVSFLTTLRLEREVEFVVDINPYRQGKFMPGTGQEIVGPGFLTRYRPDCVIVMNPIYLPEISRHLRNLGIAPELAAV